MASSTTDVAPRSRVVDAPSGLRLHLLEWPGDGEPILLLHGFGDHAWVWAEVVTSLVAGRPVAALDLRGHGDSDLDRDGRYDVPSFVADVLAAVHALGQGPVSLVGHSLGGRVAAYFAAQHPALVAELVMVDSGPELNRSGIERLLSDIATMPDAFSSPEAYRLTLQATYPLATSHALDRLVLHGLRRDAPDRFARKLDPRFRDPTVARRATAVPHREMWELLRLIDHRTLVVRGVASAVLSPAVAERMVEILPDAALVTVPRAGHAVNVDNPIGLGEALHAFLSSSWVVTEAWG